MGVGGRYFRLTSELSLGAVEVWFIGYFFMEFVDSVLDHHICGFEWPNLHFFFFFFGWGCLD